MIPRWVSSLPWGPAAKLALAFITGGAAAGGYMKATEKASPPTILSCPKPVCPQPICPQPKFNIQPYKVK